MNEGTDEPDGEIGAENDSAGEPGECGETGETGMLAQAGEYSEFELGEHGAELGGEAKGLELVIGNEVNEVEAGEPLANRSETDELDCVVPVPEIPLAFAAARASFFKRDMD